MKHWSTKYKISTINSILKHSNIPPPLFFTGCSLSAPGVVTEVTGSLDNTGTVHRTTGVFDLCMDYRVAQKKVDHHAICEHNLRKLLLSIQQWFDSYRTQTPEIGFGDDKELTFFAMLFVLNILCDVIRDVIVYMFTSDGSFM